MIKTILKRREYDVIRGKCAVWVSLIILLNISIYLTVTKTFDYRDDEKKNSNVLYSSYFILWLIKSQIANCSIIKSLHHPVSWMYSSNLPIAGPCLPSLYSSVIFSLSLLVFFPIGLLSIVVSILFFNFLTTLHYFLLTIPFNHLTS